MPLEPILELRIAAVIHAAAVHLRVDGSAHASRAEDGPRRPTELGEEIRPLDSFKDHALAAVDADSLARPRHRQAISVGQLQCPYLGIEGRGVEAGAEEAQDLAVLPGEHLSFAALGDFLEPAFDCHRGGRYYKPCPKSRSVTEVTSATMGAIDYDAWAQTYDDTRGASPSVLRPMLTALGPAASRSLLDIGGGTGNFAKALADEGFHVRLCDYSPEMARRAVVKLSGAPVFVADAAHLPFAEGSFDSAISVNVLGHVEDWRSMLSEARRVIRGGPYVMKASTRETLEANWVVEYLPGIRDHAPVHHYQRESAIIDALREAGFSRVELSRVHYTEMADGSIQALKHFPEVFLDDERILNTATLKRLPGAEREAGLAALRRDYASGRLKKIVARYAPLVGEYGDGSVFAAWP